MDSRLDSLFRVLPRHAESADTRLGIRRDEKQDQGGRKDNGPPEDDNAGAAADRMSVSIATLILFLENLLGGPSPASAPPESGGGAEPAPLSPSARAAQAYQTTDRGGRPPPAPPAPQPQAAAAGTITLSAEEVRDIHKLIDSLKQLSARRVDTLDIVWSGSFMQSITDALRAAGG